MEGQPSLIHLVTSQSELKKFMPSYRQSLRPPARETQVTFRFLNKIYKAPFLKLASTSSRYIHREEACLRTVNRKNNKNGQYQVGSILKERKVNGVAQYLLSWSGDWPAKVKTKWVAEKKLLEPPLVAAYKVDQAIEAAKAADIANDVPKDAPTLKSAATPLLRLQQHIPAHVTNLRDRSLKAELKFGVIDFGTNVANFWDLGALDLSSGDAADDDEMSDRQESESEEPDNEDDAEDAEMSDDSGPEPAEGSNIAI